MVSDNSPNNQLIHVYPVQSLAVASVLLGRSVSYLRTLADIGELQGAYKSGGVWLVHVPAARAYLAARRDGRRSA